MAELVRIAVQAAHTIDLVITASLTAGGIGAALVGAGVWGIVRSRRAGVR